MRLLFVISGAVERRINRGGGGRGVERLAQQFREAAAVAAGSATASW